VAYPQDGAIGVIRAAVLAVKHAKDPSRAEAALLEAVQAKPSPVLQLSLAQLQINGGNNRKALETLCGIPELTNKPGWVATMVALHEAENNHAAAIAVVTEAAQAAASDSTLAARDVTLREAAKYLLKRQQYEQAADTFEQLLKVRKDDPEAVAGLVQALGHFDPERAEKYAERIPTLEGSDDIDAEELELQTVEQANKGARRRDGAEVDGDDEAAELAEAAEKAATEALAAKRRLQRQEKRKATVEKRLPKALQGLPQDKYPPLDPERWLAKRDRSNYKPRRGKKKHEGKYGGHQGGAVSERAAKEFDRSEKAEEPTSPNATEPASPEPKQQKKKKKPRR